LARKVFKDVHQDFNGEPVWKTLLKPTMLYNNIVTTLVEKYTIKGIAHITGGGLYENVPRIIPEGLCAKLYKDKIPQQEIFKTIMEAGKIEEDEMYGTFNMGVGLVIVVDKTNVESILSDIATAELKGFVLGEVVSNNNKIELL